MNDSIAECILILRSSLAVRRTVLVPTELETRSSIVVAVPAAIRLNLFVQWRPMDRLHCEGEKRLSRQTNATVVIT